MKKRNEKETLNIKHEEKLNGKGIKKKHVRMR